jgi:hypothetical protein
MWDFIIQNWVQVVILAMAFARGIFSLLPTDSPAVPVFGWLDKFVTWAFMGDRRTKKKVQK